MRFEPRSTSTEKIVDPNAAYMEFDLTTDMGYGEWLAFFMQRDVVARRFNGYLLQTDVNVGQISTTPIEIHLYTRGMFVSAPGETEEYYYELPRPSLRLARAYFLPDSADQDHIQGYQPKLDELLGLDLWFQDESGEQMIYTFFYTAELQTENGIHRIERYQLQ